MCRQCLCVRRERDRQTDRHTDTDTDIDRQTDRDRGRLFMSMNEMNQLKPVAMAC